ncbi:hypothetical protein DPEC_G00116400 [Dallia pectoralis]|uniref:Uncharacterized protein n=1 Tax=Dallia pectoralis TaxID=75939 RepID=A0ACC2GUH3_DALPE|nr:hypothetical protein DPEC_G00116400 [Dallia pectoralis]
MEGRPNRGGQTSWKRSGNDSSSSGASGGEQRVRGRGRYGTGRGKRDHYRGRGRGGPPAAFERGQNLENRIEMEEDDGMEVFTKRKLESNWDRYEESEKPESKSDMPAQRGTDYHIVLESAGDSFSQFRFSEEKEWEMDPLANPMAAVFIDLPALARSLQELPLHRRLNLDTELVQVTTPMELPSITMATKRDSVAMGISKPSLRDLPTAGKGVIPNLGATSAPPVRGTAPLISAAAEPLLVDDVELDHLLSLTGPESRPGSVVEQITVLGPDQSVTEEKFVPQVMEEKQETKVKEEVAEPVKTNTTAKKVTQEDLEDWLDSMIS